MHKIFQKMSKIQIISLMDSSPWGGSEVLWYETSLLLKRLGHQVKVFVKYWQHDLVSGNVATLNKHGVLVGFWGIPQRPAITLKERIQRRINRLTQRNEHQKQVFDLDCDLTIFSSPGNGFDFETIKPFINHKIPYALIVQSVSESYWPADNIR
jgi:hypothetical protein